MSGENSANSHAAPWTVAILIALPVLYVLSVPPLLRAAGFEMTPRFLHLEDPPAWARCYCAPYRGLYRLKPLDKLLEDYAERWGLVIPAF